jgi:hypothetical protein
MTNVLFEIDGQPTPMGDCSWLMYAPCGCLCGASSVRDVAMTDEQAWASLEPNTEQRRRDKAAGFRVKIGLRSDVMALKHECTHDPKWGVAKTPIPDGYQWARQFSSRPGRRKHLVPDIGVENFREQRWTAGKTAPLCGGKAEFHWSTEWYALDAPECLACAKKASA